MQHLYVLSVLILCAIFCTPAPLTDCPTKESNVSTADLLEPFGYWHTIAIAGNSPEKFDGLNSMIISMDNRSTFYLYVDRKDGICTKMEINYSNYSVNASRGNSGYKILASNTEYFILHHYNHGKCATETFFLFGRNLTVNSATMEYFNRLVDCAAIPDLSIYTLPQENGKDLCSKL
ncbi:hypothetical protein chiPu_0013021 [Chiloscyllium punctatum]|uniref:Lipocalin/cytosolic fatty-acid binding domain-containing protein n=1 Tax=Chiloscyllium punctatum TaxID=137246 RepID=A0A401SW14_CHIPU|nr:hypothetical protein [Chiloscyllium punctatum]